jgi:hypothetical protein
MTMRKLWLTAALAMAMAPGSGARAQQIFEGTWKIDLNKVQFSAKPDVYLLQGGMYSCKTCAPPYSVKADGADHPVPGHPYYDTVAVQVVDAHTIKETDKKGGKAVATSTTTISSDGKTMTTMFTDASDTNGGPPVTGKASARRVAAGPAGSHAVSGSWQMAKVDDISENALLWAYMVENDTIMMTSKTGQFYTARVDGTEAPVHGDPGVTSVVLKMIGKNTLVETDKRDGKVVSVMTFVVAPDGKTAKATVEDKLAGRTTTFDAEKQ